MTNKKVSNNYCSIRRHPPIFFKNGKYKLAPMHQITNYLLCGLQNIYSNSPLVSNLANYHNVLTLPLN